MERRKNDRFEIPGAKIVYKLSGGETGMTVIKDLAKCSVRFSIHHFIKLGDELELEILIPDGDNISISGNVIRLSDPHQEKMTGAVVQFLPFGTLEGYNSFRVYEQLNALLSRYIQH